MVSELIPRLARTPSTRPPRAGVLPILPWPTGGNTSPCDLDRQDHLLRDSHPWEYLLHNHGWREHLPHGHSVCDHLRAGPRLKEHLLLEYHARENFPCRRGRWGRLLRTSKAGGTTSPHDLGRQDHLLRDHHAREYPLHLPTLAGRPPRTTAAIRHDHHAREHHHGRSSPSPSHSHHSPLPTSPPRLRRHPRAPNPRRPSPRRHPRQPARRPSGIPSSAVANDPHGRDESLSRKRRFPTLPPCATS